MSSQSDNSLYSNPQAEFQGKIEHDLSVKQQQLAATRRKSFIMSEIARSQDPEDAEFEEQIQTRIYQKQERERLKRIAQAKDVKNPDFWTYFFSKNMEYFSITVMELNLLLLTYPLQTLKTRIQARHHQEDVSYFIKNQVKEKPMYQGISQGLLGVLLGNTISINTFKYVQLKLSDNKPSLAPYSPFKAFRENLLAHALGDIASLPCRIFFDAKKQFLQMNHTTYDFWQVMKACKIGILPVFLRDLIFRAVFNCANYAILYGHYYYSWFRNPRTADFYAYESRLTSNQKVGSLLMSTILAAVLSNPFDVVATKVMTQQYDKYTGMVDCMKTVTREETVKKLWLSGFGARTAFFAINGYVVINYYPIFKDMVQEAYSL